MPNDGDKKGTRFSLHHACMIGDGDMTQHILKSGTNPSIKDIRGYTALHYACRGGHFACVNSLLCHSDDPVALLQVPSNDGTTPLSMQSETSGESLLHFACKYKEKIVLQKLLQSGADPNVKDNSGLTPLMSLVLSSVVSSSTSEMVDALHSYGCNLNAALEVSETNLEMQLWSGRTALHMAIGTENVDDDCIKSLISCEASIQATDTQGRAPLHIACIIGYFDSLDLLAPNEDYFQIKDSSGCTPLYYVCRYGHCEYFRKVLTHCPKILLQVVNSDGATPLTVVDEEGRTILHHACREGYDDVTIDLLEAGADPSIKDSQGYTPLHYACENGHNKCVQAIFYSSKDPSTLTEIKDANGRIPLHIACVQQHPHLLKALKPSHEHFLIKDNDGYTPLYYICTQGDCLCLTKICALSDETPGISSLLTAKVTADGATPLTIVDEEGQTVFHHVCLKGDEDLTLRLLKAGADPMVQDSQGNTPLHYVCQRGDIYYLNHFIKKYSDSHTLWQIPNSNGVTPLSMQIVGNGRTMLHLVCEEQDYKLIRKFLKAGADPNAYDASGFTPLMRVIAKDSIADHVANDIVAILCKFKCDLTLTLRKLMPSNIQNTSKSTRIWDGTALHMAAKVGSKPLCVQTLTAQCTTAVDAKDEHGRIPLHIAALYGHHNLINFLAPHPEYFLVKDNNGCTPLYYACKNGNYRCIHKIYQQIANDVILDQCIQVANNDGITPLTVKDTNGRTILHHALRRGNIKLACRLLRAGADPAVKDHSGITPLTLRLKSKNERFSMKNRTLLHHLCCEDGNFDLIVELLQAGADPNAQDGNGYTPLMLALRYINDTDASRIFFAFCDFHHEISDCVNHSSLLHIATEYNKAECVELLIAKGADLLARNSNGKNPLHIACMKGYDNLVVYLLTDKSIEVKDITGSMPLHYACKYGHMECVRKIISMMENDQLKALFQMTDLEGITPLNGTNSQRRTILHHTCAAHDLSLVQDLLRYGACPNAQDNAGLTPLMTALTVNQSGLSEILLQITNKMVSSNSVSWDPHIKDRRGWTVLHYAAGHENVRIAYILLVAGCDTSVEDDNGQTFSNLMSRKSLQLLSKQLLRIDRRQIVCVIGYPKSGKTTLIAAFKQVPRSTLQKVSTFFQNDRITLTDSRTAGIDTSTFSDVKLGNIVFFDFAGQSEYYASHLAFLESALAPKGAAITFIMVVDLRLDEEEKFRQCMEWLFPVKSIVKVHNILNVLLIGSHQDQLKSGSSTAAVQSLYTIMHKLKTTLSTPCLQFIDCWGMDCRHLSSKGMARLQEYLISRYSSYYNSDEGRHAPLGASLLFHKLKNLDNPPLAITPCMIIDKLKNGHHPFPLTVNYIDKCCQDLSAAGIVLYFLDREDVNKSWLILEIEEILGRIHGKLFAPDHSDFPMHHKNLANQFGLVQTDELKVAFTHSPLDPDMVQRLLMSMEFCHPIDSSLMKEETNSMHIGLEFGKSVVEGQLGFFLTEADFQKKWLFFPSLVRVDRGITMSTEFDVSPVDCHWVCWELSTVSHSSLPHSQISTSHIYSTGMQLRTKAQISSFFSRGA